MIINVVIPVKTLRSMLIQIRPRSLSFLTQGIALKNVLKTKNMCAILSLAGLLGGSGFEVSSIMAREAVNNPFLYQNSLNHDTSSGLGSFQTSTMRPKRIQDKVPTPMVAPKATILPSQKSSLTHKPYSKRALNRGEEGVKVHQSNSGPTLLRTNTASFLPSKPSQKESLFTKLLITFNEPINISSYSAHTSPQWFFNKFYQDSNNHRLKQHPHSSSIVLFFRYVPTMNELNSPLFHKISYGLGHFPWEAYYMLFSYKGRSSWEDIMSFDMLMA